jgi:S1-C subfamily serine protease
MRPPLTGAEPSRGGSGTFIGLIVIMVLLVGALGYDKGLFGPGVLSWVQQQQQAYSPAPPADAVRPVRGPLTTSEAAALQRSVGPGLVNITAELTSQHAVGAGTGIKLTSDGEVLTNNHVIRGASSLKVTDIGNGHTYSATVIGYDEDHDIAVLQMRGASGLRTATLGDSDSVQIGDQVAAIGNAGGVGGRPSVATGPVTDLDRTINTSDELTGTRERLTGLIEANANVQPGDSGGPMVNTEGEVIGVDVAASVDARSQTPDGTGFAIPINSAMAVVRQIRSGSASDAVHIGETAMLGVSINPISDRAVREAAAELGQPLPTHNGATGAYVTSVGYASPAQQVGLEGGDVITSLDGAPVDSATRLKTLINTHRPGDRVAVSWVQPTGRQQSASVQLVPGPPN